MDGFADLLTDAFSESSVPSFSDGDLDFENLNFEESAEEDKADNLTTKSADALLQEATAESEVSLDEAATDALLTTADAYEEQPDDEGDEVNLMSETPADEYTSSGEEGSSSGEDPDVGTIEEPGDLLMSVCSSETLQDTTKEDRIFAEGQPVASEGAGDPKVSNEVQEEAESDEEVSDAEEIPVQEDELMMKSADEPASEDDLSDTEPEGMKIEQEENVLEQEAQTSYMINPAEDCVEFPSLSLQNLQDLITEVDGEEYVDKMTDFTEDEHQEAGESFADYPSDFSSGEYTRAEGKNEEKVLNASHRTKQEGAVTETPWPLRAEDTEKDEGFLFSRGLEVNADEITTLEVAAEQQDERKSESDESTSDSSSDDEDSPRRSGDEASDNMRVQDGESYKKPESIQLHDYSSAEFSRWSLSDDHNRNDRAELTDFIRSEFDVLKTDTLLSEYLFTTEDSDETDDPPSGVNQRPVEDGNLYSVVQREDANPTTYNQGSIDDSFFFNTELDTSEVPEVRQLTDQEYEERRNYEQMQERIEAFKRFYDNSDEEDGREERQIKVQFCADPLSQIIRYETDSSDGESLSSYSDREEEEEEDDDDDEEEEEEENVEEDEKEEEVEEEEEDETLLQDEDENVEEEEEENLLKDKEEMVEEEEEEENLLKDEEEMVEEEEEEDNLLGEAEAEEEEEEEENLLKDEEEKVGEEEEEENLLEEEEEAEAEEEEEEENLLEEEEAEAEEEEEEENLLEEEEAEAEEEEEEENLLEEEEEEKMEGEEKEEDLSSAEIFDELMEPEDSLKMNPVCNPANIQLSQNLSEVTDTQTCTKTHKGLCVLKTMVKLAMVTAMGLLMFWLISDQPDWLKDVFSV